MAKIPTNIEIKAVDKASGSIKKVAHAFSSLKRINKSVNRTLAGVNVRMAAVGQTMRKTSNSLNRTGRKLTRNVTAPIGLAGAAILRTGYNFDKSMNKVAAITGTVIGGKVTPQFKALRSEARRLGSSTERSATEAADAMAILGRAGFKTSEILKTTKDVLSLSTASGQELAFTADVMSKTIRGFGLEANQSQRVADVLADVTRKTNIDLETLSETFKDAAPIAKTYGMSLEQTAALTGLLGDVGIQGSKAGTTLKAMMLKLATPTAKAQKVMQSLGVSVNLQNGKMKDLGRVLTELGPGLGKLNKNKQLEALNELFGLRGIAGASALMSKAMKDGKNPVATLTKLLKGSTGAAKEMRDIMLGGSVEAVTNFKSALESLSITISGEGGLLPAFTVIIKKITSIIKWLSAVSPTTLKVIVVFATLTAVLGPLSIVLGSVISLMLKFGKAYMFLQTLRTAGALGKLAFLANPFVWGTTAILGAVAAIGRIIYKWKELKKVLSGNFSFIKKMGKMWDIFKWWGKSSTTPHGPSTGAEKAKQKIIKEQAMVNEKVNHASVNVDFSNLPRGTKVTQDSPSNVNLNLGFSREFA